MPSRHFILFAAAALVWGTSASAGSLTSQSWDQEVKTGFVNTTVNVGVGATGSATALLATVVVSVPATTLANSTGTLATSPVFIKGNVFVSLGGGTQTLSITSGGVNVVGNNVTGRAQVRLGNALGPLVADVPLSPGNALNTVFTISTIIPFVGNITAMVSVMGDGWTVGTVTVIGLTTPATGTTNMYTGSWNITAGGAGTVTLVSPSRTTVTGTAASSASSVTTLTLSFSGVPEPGTTLLLGAGLAGLILVGRRRS